MLEIRVNNWSCAMSEGCLSGSTFFTVSEIGCPDQGQLMATTYNEGVQTVSTPRLDLRADVRHRKDGDRITVLEAKLTYRTKDEAAAR
jgi:hypothetical protein